MKLDFEKNVQENKNIRVLFVEGWNKHMQHVALEFIKKSIATPILIFEKRSQINCDLNKMEFLIIDEFSEFDLVVDEFKKCREIKNKVATSEEIAALKSAPLFATTLVASKKFNYDCGFGGTEFSSGEILKSIFKTIGTRENLKASSAKVLTRDDLSFVLTDVSVNPSPTPIDLANSAELSAEFALKLGLIPQIAFLSYSTNGSAKSEEVSKVQAATRTYLEFGKFPAIGEVQFDAAISEEVRAKKKVINDFKGPANILVFPSLESGNISSKIMQRMGNFEGAGPIILGLKKPFNNLSRGAGLKDVYNTAILTVMQAEISEEK